MRRKTATGIAWVLVWMVGCSEGDGDRTFDDAGSTDGSACRTENWCWADFPCDHYLIRDSYRPACGGEQGRLFPRTVPCAEVCGTPCCSGSSCELVSEPCPEGTVCRMRGESPECLPPCDRIPTFADAVAARRLLHVSADGDDAAGDGTSDHPYQTLAAAARTAVPGDGIFLDGSTTGDNRIVGLRGTETDPIRIYGRGSSPGSRPRIEGGIEGLRLVAPAYVVIEDLVVIGQSGSGIVIEDDGDGATPARHVVVRNVAFRDIGPGGDNGCLQLSGLDEFFVLDNTFAGCGVGGSGSGIDMIGCHEGVVAGNSFGEVGARSVRARGGSASLELRANATRDGGDHAFELGGSTPPELFRPLDAGYEARDVRAVANLIVGSAAAVAFIGCEACLAANNTIIRPARWVARILQESGPGLVPCRNGRFVNNLVVVRRADLTAAIDVGPGTAALTFTFAGNLWFAEDDPAFAGTGLPVAETGTVVGDPLFVDGPGGDYHLLADSPAVGAGTTLAEVAGDFDGNCYRDPPTIGAFERTE